MEYIKDFEGWNKKKKGIHLLKNHVSCKEGEIWWCSLGVNIDIEIDGKNDLYERPVLIIKKINYKSVWVVPLTSSSHKQTIYRYYLASLDSDVSLSQIRNISTKRLLRSEMKVSFKEYTHIIIRLKFLLDIDNENTL